jgi:lysozyme family protein
MADFNQAVQKTLIHEGGYTNNPHDAGGETYRGISRVNHRDWAGWTIIDGYKGHPNFPRVLDSDQRLQQLVIKEYVDGYWKNLYSQINDQSVAEKLFDMGVLMGVKVAVKLLQLTISNEISIVSDGTFGDQTLIDVNQEDAGLLQRYRTMLIQHFINIVNNNPNDSEFLQGWINRVNS